MSKSETDEKERKKLVKKIKEIIGNEGNTKYISTVEQAQGVLDNLEALSK